METASTLLSILCTFTPLLGFCLVFLLFGAFMVFFVWRSFSPLTSAQQAAAIAENEQWTAQAASTLAPWNERTVLDLAADWLTAPAILEVANYGILAQSNAMRTTLHHNI